MSSSSNRPRFTDSELESLRLWATPNFGADGKYEEVIEEEEEAILVEEEPPVPQLTVEEIEAIQQQAQAEGFAVGKEEGYKQGFVEGSKKGYDENVHLIEVRTNQLVTLLESLSEPFKHLDDRVEHALANLAVKIAKQILHREIELDSGQVIAAVKAAVNALPIASQNITIHLHPEDAELVRFNLGLNDSPSAWQIIEDPSITRGGCKVDSDVSHVDATIENRLGTVLESLFGEDFIPEEDHDPES
jgi:flagellar assembly protein FliH